MGRPIDDPVVLARVAAIFRASAAEKLSRSATPPALKREAGDPLPLHGVPGTFPTNAGDPQIASAGLGNPINA